MNRQQILYFNLFMFVVLYVFVLYVGILGTSYGNIGIIIWSVFEIVVIYGIFVKVKDIENYAKDERKITDLTLLKGGSIAK